MPEPATISLLGTSFIAMSVRFMHRKYHEAKPWFDRIAALFMLAVAAPIIGACALLVKMTSRGPAFYTQERVGKDGKVFEIVKLRSMRIDAETGTGPVWANQEDSRTTPIGAILRNTHLDELPQLLNVLRGEMSLVGPRPERPYFVKKLEKAVPGYGERLAVKPGITGLAQINAPADTTLQDVERKVEFDNMYIQRMCWMMDFVVILKTLRKFTGRS